MKAASAHLPGGHSITLLLTWRSMGRIAVVLLSLCCGTGCQWLLKGAELPHAKGTWIGRVVPVQVQTNKGVVHQATALEVESGPELPFSVWPEFGAGKKPLLVRDGDNVKVIIDPAELPIGRRIRIKGTSYAALAFLPHGPMNSLEEVHRPYEGPQDQPIKPEHILIVREKPKVLE